jgi:hypothetical protein
MFNKTVEEENIISPTGLLYLDVDCIKSDDELTLIKNNISELPFVVACWVSLSGKGLSFLVKVDGMTSENYSAFKDYFKKYFNGNDILIGYILDKGAFKTIQRTVISRDENIYINYDAVPVNYMDVSAINNQSSTDIYNPSLSILIGKEYNVEDLMSGSEKKLTSIKFSNEDDYMVVDDEAYIVHKEKVPVINIYLPKGGKIKEGERHRIIFLIACKLLAINGKEKKKDILHYLLHIQKYHCDKPETFREKEVKTILDRAVKNLELKKIKPRFKRVTFNSAMGFTAKEKQSIGGKAVAELKRNNTIELLNKHYSQGIIQKKLSELSGVSERTIQRYWNVAEDGKVFFAQKKKFAPDHTKEIAQEGNSLQLSATTIIMATEHLNENIFTDEEENVKLDKFLGRVSTETGTDYFGTFANKNPKPKPLTPDEMEWALSLNLDEIFKEESQPEEVKVEPAPQLTEDDLKELILEWEMETVEASNQVGQDFSTDMFEEVE